MANIEVDSDQTDNDDMFNDLPYLLERAPMLERAPPSN